jgi:plastocyanin
MKKGALLVVGLLTGGLWAMGAPAALAGGSCFAPSSSAAGVRVQISEICFHPTVLYVKPGARVTWANTESVDHTVTGLGGRWGTVEPLHQGQSITATFKKEGVYPYSCVIHYGMVGAVVVGTPSATQSTGTEASGLAQPTSEAVASPAAAQPAAPAKVVTVTRESGLGPVGVTGWVLFALAGIGLVATVVRRRRSGAGS